MRRIGQQGPEDHDGVDVEFLDDRQQLRTKCAPAHVGFQPAHQYDIAVTVGWAAVRDPHRWPLQLPGNPVDLSDDRPIHLIVVVGLVVDLHDGSRVPDGGKVSDRVAGGVARVVPALKRRHNHGLV
ncbi:hypothetical protein MMEU_1321 [Mycobacterium marinum str. Europe]|nr:hypothetical protein MMEU_1321 [Mycobacterium marinum str. Europe]